jgi:hypothetical protein
MELDMLPNVQKFDPNTPSIARVYDYLLGGYFH